MKILIKPDERENIIVTTVIGETYYNSWFNYAFPSWETYCLEHGLGLIVFTEHLVNEGDKFWKKPYWQKLLIGDVIKKETNYKSNICFLDSDIIINPHAPNIFEQYDSETIGIVSQKTDLPYPLDEVLRRIAFFRHHFMDKKYPLDSYLFASIQKIFELHNLPPQNNFACTGLFVFNIENHAQLFYDWYVKYLNDTETVDGGTEEVHLNYEIQNYGKVTWLDYRFQALWIYEMAWKYPFLYQRYHDSDDQLVLDCIEASTLSNFFLHFAGAWEGDMWKKKGIMTSERTRFVFDEFAKYLQQPLTGEPKGIIKPTT